MGAPGSAREALGPAARSAPLRSRSRIGKTIYPAGAMAASIAPIFFDSLWDPPQLLSMRSRADCRAKLSPGREQTG
jgi:hypothetical protein